VNESHGNNKPVTALRVDAHVHIRAPEALGVAAAAGITALRDAGTKQGSGLTVGRQRNERSGVTCLSAGWALCKQGGYGAHFGVPVKTREDIASEIQRLKQAGADIIKVMASGMVSLTDPGGITPGGFSREELGFIVAHAAAAGLAVMAHANGETAIVDAVEAGVRSVEHGFFMTEQALEKMARGAVFWVPTVRALARAMEERGAAGEARAFTLSLISAHQAMLVSAHAMGVPLAIGTDCVLPATGYKEEYEAELTYFEHAGLSQEIVEKIACEGGALLLGI